LTKQISALAQLSLLMMLVFLQKGNEFSLSSCVATDQVIHVDGIVLKDNETFTIKDCLFIQSGDVLVMDNATLIIQNATLILSYNESIGYQYSIRIRNNANVKILEANITSDRDLNLYEARFFVHCYENSTVKIDKTKFGFGPYLPPFLGIITCYDNSYVQLNNSGIGNIFAYNNSLVKISNTEISLYLASYGESKIEVDHSSSLILW
jgi:hypothetical protein